MPRFRPWPLAAILTVAVHTAPAVADWQEDLALQMQWDHDCEVSFFSNVIERDVDGETVVIAKAHCVDGRVFDAIQRGAFEDFEVNECTPVEQAC